MLIDIINPLVLLSFAYVIPDIMMMALMKNANHYHAHIKHITMIINVRIAIILGKIYYEKIKF